MPWALRTVFFKKNSSSCISGIYVWLPQGANLYLLMQKLEMGARSPLPPRPGLSELLDVLSLLLAWTPRAGGQARWASPSAGLYSDFPDGSDAPGKAESRLWRTWARHIFCSSGDIFGAAGIWDANTDYRTRLCQRGKLWNCFQFWEMGWQPGFLGPHCSWLWWCCAHPHRWRDLTVSL